MRAAREEKAKGRRLGKGKERFFFFFFLQRVSLSSHMVVFFYTLVNGLN